MDLPAVATLVTTAAPFLKQLSIGATGQETLFWSVNTQDGVTSIQSIDSEVGQRLMADE